MIDFHRHSHKAARQAQLAQAAIAAQYPLPVFNTSAASLSLAD